MEAEVVGLREVIRMPGSVSIIIFTARLGKSNNGFNKPSNEARCKHDLLTLAQTSKP